MGVARTDDTGTDKPDAMEWLLQVPQCRDNGEVFLPPVPIVEKELFLPVKKSVHLATGVIKNSLRELDEEAALEVERHLQVWLDWLIISWILIFARCGFGSKCYFFFSCQTKNFSMVERKKGKICDVRFFWLRPEYVKWAGTLEQLRQPAVAYKIKFSVILFIVRKEH